MEDNGNKIFGFFNEWRLIKNLIIFFVILIFIFVYLFAILAFRNLDDKVVYNVDVISEAFEYTISAQTSPNVLLQRFTPLVHNCKSMQEIQQYHNGTIQFKRGVRILVERKSNSKVKLTAALVNDGATSSLGILINQFERCKLGRKAVFEIELDREFPIFSINIIGDIQIGRVLSDAADDYYPLVKSGQIVIQDKTTFSKAPISLSAQPVRPGDTLFLSDAKGIIRASYEESGLIGVFSQLGNKVLLKHLYAEYSEEIVPSFIDRITNDSELAFSLSVSFIFIQCISFFIKLALFSRSVMRSAEQRKIKKWKINR